MIAKLIALMAVGVAPFASAQVVQDPIADGKARPGRTYLKWTVDVNHDGIDDVLVAWKETPDEIAERKAEEGHYFNEDDHTFAVYLGRSAGGYTKVGGIDVDTSECYVGYISEVRSYGIVTLELLEVSAPHGKGLPIPKNRVVCYTFKNGTLKTTRLSPLYDLNGSNRVHDKYLSPSKCVHVTLQDVTR
jgi:hypothetical protein